MKQHPGGDLAYGRYYPTMLNLPNGEVLVLAGRDRDFNGATIPEIISTNEIRKLPGAEVPDFAGVDYWYPHAFVNSRGEVIIIEAYNSDMYRMSTQGNGGVEKIGTSGVQSYKLQPSIMIAPDTIALLAVDGGIHVANIAENVPQFQKVASLGKGRINAAMVHLPDGRVAFMGGEEPATGTGQNLSKAITKVQIWNPENNQVQSLNEKNAVARLYHSSGILLPDATVWTGGGGAPGPIANANTEIYAPDYMFDRPSNQYSTLRPKIISAPKNVITGQTMTVKVDDAGRIN